MIFRVDKRGKFAYNKKTVHRTDLYGGVKVSTGIVSYGKRVVVVDHYKTTNLLKLNDNNKVALAA